MVIIHTCGLSVLASRGIDATVLAVEEHGNAIDGGAEFRLQLPKNTKGRGLDRHDLGV